MEELEEIRAILERVMAKLEDLDQRLRSLEASSAEVKMYRSLLRAYASILGSVAKVERLAQLVADEMDRAIVRVLAAKGPMNITEITEELRSLRGTASRRIVAMRLERLRERGIVERIGGRGKVYRLKPGLIGKT